MLVGTAQQDAWTTSILVCTVSMLLDNACMLVLEKLYGNAVFAIIYMYNNTILLFGAGNVS